MRRFLFLAALLANCAGALAQAGPAAPARDECHPPEVMVMLRAARFDQALAYRQQQLQKLDPASTDTRIVTLSICLKTYIGAYLGRMDRSQESLEILQETVRIARQALGPDHADTLNVEFHAAVAQGRIGNHGLEIQQLQALRPRFAARHGARSAEIHPLLRALATAYVWVGNFEAALTLDREVLSIAEADAARGSCGSPRDCRITIARDQTGLAETLNKLKRPAEALPYAERAVATYAAEAGPTHPDTLDARLSVATSMGGVDGNRARAVQVEREVLELAEKAHGPDHSITRKARGNLAVSLHALGQVQESIALEQQQILSLRERRGPNHPETLLSLSNLTERLVREKEYARAQPVIEDALRAMLSSNAGLSFDDRLTLTWQQHWRRLVDHYIATLLAQQKLADAFLVIEHFKSRLLSDRLSLDPAERGLNDDAVAQLRKLRRSLGAAEQAIALKREAKLPVAREEAARAALLAQINAIRPATAVAVEPLPSNTSVPEWYRSLTAAERETLRVSYFFLGGNVYALIDNTGRLRLVGLGRRDAIRDSVEAYRLMMRAALIGRAAAAEVWLRPGGGFVAGAKPAEDAERETDAQAVLRYLSDTLVKPLAPELAGKSRLLLSPEQSLAHVPFDALRLGEARLGDTVEVLSIPSFAQYGRLQQRKAEYAKTERNLFLGIGGVQYQRARLLAPGVVVVRDSSPGLRPMDMRVIAQMVRKDPARLREAFLMHAIGFPELPGTLKEVRQIADMLRPRGTVLTLTEEDATESMLYRLADEGRLRRFRTVHFSTHGYLSEDEPSLTSIVLGQVNRAPGTDGYVTVAEIGSLDLRSDLVVVSACDSGVGRPEIGEGVLGMSYALFQAGTVASIVTLWPVREKDSAQLMIRFYEEWTGDIGPATALARAKRWALREGLHRPTVDGFVLFGI